MKKIDKRRPARLKRNRLLGTAILAVLTVLCCWCYGRYVNPEGRRSGSRTEILADGGKPERQQCDGERTDLRKVSGDFLQKTSGGAGASQKKSGASEIFQNTAGASQNTAGSPQNTSKKSQNTAGPSQKTSKIADRGSGDVGQGGGLKGLELPYCDDPQWVITSTEGRYTLFYNATYRQASWVAYLLTAADVKAKGVGRTNNFIPDPAVVERGWATAYSSHYSGSGYDRGHLCPSADRASSREENQATFHLSNISPQTRELNGGIWKELEEKVRYWAVRYDSVYVATGGVLCEGLQTIAGGVGVPEYYYKALLVRHGGKFRAIGFLMPNEHHFAPALEHYAVTIDSLERFTSLDFFHNLPDDIESEVESTFQKDFWFGNSRR